MSNISKYIAELLYFNDCVIIPKFGGFISTLNNSTINHEQNIFSPPSKQIIFNKNLRDNDGLLINFIQNKKNISFNEASLEVEKYVKSINSKISSSNSFNIDNIGILYYDQNKNLCFDQDINSNLLADSYGLSSFHFPKLEKKEAVKLIKEKFQDKESIKQSIKHPVTKKILIGIPIMIILLLLPFKSNFVDNHSLEEANILYNIQSTYDVKLENPNNINQVIENIANKENALLYIEPSNDIDILTETEINKTKIKIQDSIIKQEETKEELAKLADIKIDESLKSDTKDKYFIIAGSFVDTYRAEKFCKEISPKGFNPTIMEKNKGKIRVSIDSFSDQNEAKIALEKYRKNPELSVWLLTL